MRDRRRIRFAVTSASAWLALALAMGCDTFFGLQTVEPGRDAFVYRDAPPDAPATIVLQQKQAGSGTSSVSVSLPRPLNVGDLAIVVVGWSGLATVTPSVTDSANSYRLAGSAVVSFNQTNEAIYYACGVQAGATRLGSCADQTLSHQGSSMQSDTGSGGVTLTTAMQELLFAANFDTQAKTGAPQGSFVAELATNDGLVADLIVRGPGGPFPGADMMLNAGSQSSDSDWVMELVAFRGAQ